MSLCLCGCGSETNRGKKYIGTHWAKCESYRKNQSLIMKASCNKEEYKNKVSEQVKKNWRNNENRKLEMSKRLKEKWKSKKERENQSQMMSKVWKSKAHRNKQSEGMNKPGVSEKIALGGKKRFK